MSGSMVRKILLVPAFLTLAGIHSADAQTAQVTATETRAKQTKADSQRKAAGAPRDSDYATDLRPIISRMNLKEGANLVTTTAEGLKVYAIVEVTGLEVVDNSGTELAGGPAVNPTARRTPSRTSGSYVGTGGGEGDDPHCWHCYEKNGELHCFEISCPFIEAPGTGGGG